jgi:hypothetical protein
MTIDEKTDFGKKKSMIIKSNEIANNELIFLINVKTNSGKVAFNIIKGCNTKDYPNGNGEIAWERLKDKYEPLSKSSMVKLEKQFGELPLKIGQDTEIRITELENLCFKLEDMDSAL